MYPQGCGGSSPFFGTIYWSFAKLRTSLRTVRVNGLPGGNGYPLRLRARPAK